MHTLKFWKKIKERGPAGRPAGMTYVELIVVRGIFSVLSAIALFNYGTFQDRIDIKNLSNDVALQITAAQKLSLDGSFPPSAYSVPAAWKPSYGVYFAMASNKSFLNFVDLNNNGIFDGADCTGECLTKISITKNNSISNLQVLGTGGGCGTALTGLTVVYKRPDYSAMLTPSPAVSCAISYAQITVSSPKTTPATSVIKVYPSGRIQIN